MFLCNYYAPPVVVQRHDAVIKEAGEGVTQPLFIPNTTLQKLIKIGFSKKVPFMLIIYHRLAN